jgi:hypothetical protein
MRTMHIIVANQRYCTHGMPFTDMCSVLAGSGGRDLKTGNKRTAKQTRDQTLTGLYVRRSKTESADVTQRN